MRRVIIESPFRGQDAAEQELFTQYARRALYDSLGRGEAPFASHLLYTQVLDDSCTQQRMQGINAGLVWGQVSEATVVYKDYGVSSGMHTGIRNAERQGRCVEERYIGKNEDDK